MKKTTILLLVFVLMSIFVYAAEQKMFVNMNMNDKNITNVDYVYLNVIKTDNGQCIRSNSTAIIIEGTCTV